MKTTKVQGFGEMIKVNGKVARTTPPIKDLQAHNIASKVTEQAVIDGVVDVYTMFKALDANNEMMQNTRVASLARQDILCHLYWSDFFDDTFTCKVEEIINCSPLRNEYKRTMKTTLKRVVTVLSNGLQELVIDEKDGLEIEIIDLIIETPVQKFAGQLGKAVAVSDHETGNSTKMADIMALVKLAIEKQQDVQANKTAKKLSKDVKKAGKYASKAVYEDEKRENLSAEIAILTGKTVKTKKSA